MRLHTHLFGALGFATLAALLLPPPVARGDDTSIRVRIGGHDGVSVGFDYGDHDRYDRGRSWQERVARNFDRLSGDRGDVRKAYRRFDILASERPNAPLPRIGLGIAALRMGDEHTGVREFRRAAAESPRAFSRAPVDRGLHQDLHRLKGRLIRDAEYSGDGRTWFLVASLHLLTGHDGQARRAIRNAIECGERSHGADRMADYLGVRFDRHDRRRDRRGYKRGGRYDHDDRYDKRRDRKRGRKNGRRSNRRW